MTESRGILSRIPPAAGSIGVIQGAYGARGNLELCYPDPSSGLWVCWFNNDPPGTSAPVPPGFWSQGLRFGQEGYTSATITQATRGPDFLEVLGCAGDRLHRWTWRPESGFGLTDVLPSPLGPVSDPCCLETATGLVAAARATDRLLVWDGEADDGYPSLSWLTRPVIPLPDRTVQVATTAVADDALRFAAVSSSGQVLLGGVDAEWVRLPTPADVTLVAWPRGGHGRHLLVATADGVHVVDVVGGEPQRIVDVPGAEALAAAWSKTDGESRLELVLRCGHQISHHRVDESQLGSNERRRQ
jgi:hypothetical protein